jgi:hypothetical protein
VTGRKLHSQRRVTRVVKGSQRNMLNLKISLNGIVSFTDLNQGSEMIIFELILTTFEAPIPYEAAGAIAKIFSSLKLKPLWQI